MSTLLIIGETQLISFFNSICGNLVGYTALLLPREARVALVREICTRIITIGQLCCSLKCWWGGHAGTRSGTSTTCVVRDWSFASAIVGFVSKAQLWGKRNSADTRGC